MTQSLQQNIQLIKVGQRHILYDAALIEHPDEALFSPAKNNIQRVAEGRADAVFFHYHGLDLVRKHYHRGGLMAHLMGDRYFGVQLNRTRAYAEFRLLKSLQNMGLPAPVPVAASVIVQAVLHRADLVTKAIPGVTPLADLLMKQTIDEACWHAIGGCVKKFHDHNVFHADLNARNILVGENNEVYLIDFDKSGIRLLGNSWKASNLARLQRSLYKFESNEAEFHFTENNWRALLAAYQWE